MVRVSGPGADGMCKYRCRFYGSDCKVDREFIMGHRKEDGAWELIRKALESRRR